MTSRSGGSRGAPELEPNRQLRTVRNLATIRWAAIVWAAIQVFTYYLPYPAGVLPWAIAAVGVLLGGNTAIWLGLPRARTAAAVRRQAVVSVLVDGIAIVTLVYVYTFDPNTAIWATLYIVPLGAAALFQLPLFFSRPLILQPTIPIVSLSSGRRLLRLITDETDQRSVEDLDPLLLRLHQPVAGDAGRPPAGTDHDGAAGERLAARHPAPGYATAAISSSTAAC